MPEPTPAKPRRHGLDPDDEALGQWADLAQQLGSALTACEARLQTRTTALTQVREELREAADALCPPRRHATAQQEPIQARIHKATCKARRVWIVLATIEAALEGKHE